MKPWTSPTPHPHRSEGKEFSPATQETLEMWVQSQGGEDPLEEGTATLSSILAWKLSWTEDPGGPQFIGCKESGTPEMTEHSMAQHGDFTSF